jgi:hypothetical protein
LTVNPQENKIERFDTTIDLYQSNIDNDGEEKSNQFVEMGTTTLTNFKIKIIK